MVNYKILKRLPTVEEFHKLHVAVGWDNVDKKATEFGLHNSLFSVCVVHKGEVIGCGRVIGDGGVYFYIQDIIVLPEFQGKKIGEKIMDEVMKYLKKTARPNAFIGLMAAKRVSRFYERYGFTKRPSNRPGMFKIWGK